MPKTSKRKPKSSSAAVERAPKRSRVPRDSGQVAGKRGAGKRLRGLATDDKAIVLVQPDELACAVDALKPGWVEEQGRKLAEQDVEKNGKKKPKIYVRPLESRIKMKLAQRARRAREHQEAR